MIYICIVFFGCGVDSEIEYFHTVPTLSIPLGETVGFDLSVYKSKPTMKLHFEFHPDLILRIDNAQDSLYIFAKESSSKLIFLNGTADNDPFHLLVRIEPTIAHTFQFTPTKKDISIAVIGSFNDWSKGKNKLMDEDQNGIYELTLYLKPESYQYKFIVGDEFILDPKNKNVVSNNIGGWNSLLDLTSFKKSKSGEWIKGTQMGNQLKFIFIPSDMSLPVKTFVMFNNIPLHPDQVNPQKNGDVNVNIGNLSNGLLRITGLDSEGRVIKENHTILSEGRPLNLKENPDDWHFKVLYSVMVDRFFDGDKTNNIKTEGDIHPLTKFHGGDFIGLTQKVEDGYFSDLGVSALWISPVQKQPKNYYSEWNNTERLYSGYHGYWPVSQRETDSRFGTSEELKNFVNVSHSNNLKVCLDFVSNHVHENHPYFTKHREWFGDVNLPDGSLNIRRWDGETRLTTWFNTFLPSFNYLDSPKALDIVVEDAVWWLREYNFDGFRQDAVKHVPHVFWKSLTHKMKEEFPNNNFFQIGETFGSNELILSYVNPSELDGQFNFDIYFSARKVFISSNGDLESLKEVVEKNLLVFQPINLMGTLTSSHDQIRFISVADGQMTYDEDGNERSFSHPPERINHFTSYQKLANFTSFNFSMPGIPVIYYGEEIGLLGAGDPDNRRPMKFGNELIASETMLKKTVSNLAHLRKKHPAMSIGDFYTVFSENYVWAYFKVYFDEIILVAINQSEQRQSISFECPIPISSWSRLNNNIPYSMTGGNMTLHLQPFSHGLFLAK